MIFVYHLRGTISRGPEIPALTMRASQAVSRNAPGRGELSSRKRSCSMKQVKASLERGEQGGEMAETPLIRQQ